MKTYCITIEPLSCFGTPLKGDTLFGQFCWQVAYDPTLMASPLDDAISNYPVYPFAVFSSAFPLVDPDTVALKRPDAPLDWLFDLGALSREERVGGRKSFKKRRWLMWDMSKPLAPLREGRYLNDAELAKLSNQSEETHLATEFLRSHNSINRLTGTTGEGFAPYSQAVTAWYPGVKLAIFVGVDPAVLNGEGLQKGLERIGLSGFGRDASTGSGRFRVCNCREVDLCRLGTANANALYTLSPSTPEKDLYRDILFTPFTRFGRHGDRLATSGKPFKNPVIMADEGALLFPEAMQSVTERPFIGRGMTCISKAQEAAVAQGYSLCLPVRVEVNQ